MSETRDLSPMNYRVLTKTSADSRVTSALDGPFPREFGLHGCQTWHARPPSAYSPLRRENDSDVLGTRVSCFGRVDGLPALVWALANEIIRLI